MTLYMITKSILYVRYKSYVSLKNFLEGVLQKVYYILCIQHIPETIQKIHPFLQYRGLPILKKCVQRESENVSNKSFLVFKGAWNANMTLKLKLKVDIGLINIFKGMYFFLTEC